MCDELQTDRDHVLTRMADTAVPESRNATICWTRKVHNTGAVKLFGAARLRERRKARRERENPLVRNRFGGRVIRTALLPRDQIAMVAPESGESTIKLLADKLFRIQ